MQNRTVGVVVLMVLAAASAADARCDPTGADAADVAATRMAIAVACDCDGARDHGSYVRCARTTAKATLLNKSCLAPITRCATRSTCGKPDAVACCQTLASGETRASIKGKASACRTPPGGSSCLSPSSSVCDACTATGCAPPTPHPEPTPTLTATPPRAVCGNGIIEPGEFCDGEEFCTGCTLAVGGCCQISLPDESAACLAVDVAFARPCLEVAAGSFSIGTVCEGEPCGTIDVCHRSPCRDTAITPVSVCCQMDDGSGCRDAIVDSLSQLASFAIFECSSTGTATPVIGSCGADHRCVPGQ